MAVWTERQAFVDTNILCYALDADAGEKRSRAAAVIKEIWEAGTGIVSTQVLSEWMVNLHRKGRLGWDKVNSVVEPYLCWKVVVLEPHDPLEASRIAKANRLSYWDSLLIRAAVTGGATVMLTEDLNPGQIIEGVEIVNPLVR
jgi:predicted nucleic acid-binding protein